MGVKKKTEVVSDSWRAVSEKEFGVESGKVKSAGRARPCSIAAEWSIHAETQLCVGTGRLRRAV
jgi:hypothetical protein